MCCFGISRCHPNPIFSRMQVQPALQMGPSRRAPAERDAVVCLAATTTTPSKVFYSESLIRTPLIRLRVLLDFLHVSNVPTIFLLLLLTRISRAEPTNHLRDYLPTAEASGHPTFVNHQWVYLPSWVKQSKRHEGNYPAHVHYSSLILLPVLKEMQHEHLDGDSHDVHNHFDWSTVKKRDGPPRRCGMKLIKYIQK